MKSHVSRRALATLACATLTVLSATACTGADSTDQAQQNELAEPTLSAAPTDQPDTTEQPEETTESAPALTERNPEDFVVDGAYKHMYAIVFGDTFNRCVVKPAEYFGCNAEFTGTLPPNETDVALNEGPADYISFRDGEGFETTKVLGTDGPTHYETLNPNERVTLGEYTFTINADGTARGERDGHWFELTSSGQYSSPRFTP